MSQVVFWFAFVRRLCSLKIYRVESVVDGKLIGGKGPRDTVPSATYDCVTRLQLEEEFEERHNVNTQTLRPVVTGSVQSLTTSKH